MNETILNVLKAMDKEAPATIDMIEKVEKEWNVLLPNEYKQLLLFSNGVESCNRRYGILINMAY